MADYVEHQYEYEDEKLISEHLKCSLCSRPFIEPVSVRCMSEQKTYCRRCIEKWINDKHSCPTCHRNLDRRNLNPIPKAL